MEPPDLDRERPPPPSRSNRVFGLLAAIGFSIAMWAFIGLAVLGLVLKIAARAH